MPTQVDHGVFIATSSAEIAKMSMPAKVMGAAAGVAVVAGVGMALYSGLGLLGLGMSSGAYLSGMAAGHFGIAGAGAIGSHGLASLASGVVGGALAYHLTSPQSADLIGFNGVMKKLSDGLGLDSQAQDKLGFHADPGSFEKPMHKIGTWRAARFAVEAPLPNPVVPSMKPSA